MVEYNRSGRRKNSKNQNDDNEDKNEDNNRDNDKSDCNKETPACLIRGASIPPAVTEKLKKIARKAAACICASFVTEIFKS